MSKTTFGRMRGGHSTGLLLALSLTVGILVSGALGWLMSVQYPTLSPWILIAIGIACMGPILCAATWALLVDLSTVKGRADRLEETVENHWAKEATSGMGLDLMATLGLLATVVSISGIEIPSQPLLLGLILLASLSMAIRYLIAKRKGS